MNLTFLIYLVGIIDNVIGYTITISIISGFIMLISLGFYFFYTGIDEYRNRPKKVTEKYEAIVKTNCGKILKIVIPIFFLFINFSLFCPSSKTISAMYLIPKMAQNKDMQEIPKKSAELLNAKLDEWIDEIKDKNK
jgi:hypothetical protein